MSWFTSLSKAITSAAKYGMSAASLDTSATKKRKLDHDLSDLIEKIEGLKRVIGKSKRSGSPSRELDKQAAEEATSELEKLERELKDKLTKLDFDTNPEKYQRAEVPRQPRGEANLPPNCRDVASKDSIKEPLYPEGAVPEHPNRQTDYNLNNKIISDLGQSQSQRYQKSWSEFQTLN